MSRKILIIDDNAERGWKAVLKHLLFVHDQVDTAVSLDEAELKIKEIEFDLIFLDLRLRENDHKINDIEQFGGFVLIQKIRKNFLSRNFSTPVILFTASNKAWYINEMLEAGCDDYYIKEHPDTTHDENFTRNNTKRLKKTVIDLLIIGGKRKEIWKQSFDIINILSKHYYFQGDKRYINIKNRIVDKLKLGYNYLFKNQTLLEKNLLKANNETLSFIINWSILEEIVKGFSDISTTWEGTDRKEEWQFRNKEYFIERKTNQSFKINYYYDYQTKKRLRNTTITKENFDRRFGNIINLSDQVYSLLYAYSTDDEFKKLSKEFRELNNSRNEVDFIHSSINNIFHNELIRAEDLRRMYIMNKRVLAFVLDICKLIEK